MTIVRARLPLIVFVAAMGSAACSDPPVKEIEQAIGAIDAARAAGADVYARDELAAAQTALDRAREAVTLRDYRLALNYALDSRERAQNSAMMAADNKASARVEADHALTNLAAAHDSASQALQAAEARRAPARALAELRNAIAAGERSLQEARSAFEAGDYAAVVGLDGKHRPILAAAAEELAEPATRRR